MDELTLALTVLNNDVGGYLILLAVCCIRLFILFFMFPPLADGLLEGVFRNAVIVLLSVFIACGQPASVVSSLHGLQLLQIGVRESLIGLIYGFAASTVFWAAASAGTFIDDMTGYNNVQLANPLRAEQSTPTSAMFSQLACMVFWAFGGMRFLLAAVYESYRWWPLSTASFVPLLSINAFILQRTDTFAQMTAKVASPMMFVLLLIDLSFGLISKSSSRLDVGPISESVKGVATILMLAVFAGFFVEQVHDELALVNLKPIMSALYAHGL